MTTKKLISKDLGIEFARKWFDIPQSNRIKKAVYRRNHDDTAPFYTLDLHFGKGIEVVLDALTGQVIQFRRKEPILDTARSSEMDQEVFERLHSTVLDWLIKLGLPIDVSELLVFKKYVKGNNERFELEYVRQKLNRSYHPNNWR
jgi:hypothetical protein